MYRTSESRFWIWAGGVALALITGFAMIALIMLIVGGRQASSWPPPTYVMRVTLFTIGQAVASTLLAVLLALPVALAMGRRERFLGRRVLLSLMLLPLGLPVLPAIFGIVEVWGRQGFVSAALRPVGLGDFSIYGLGGILLAHVFFNLPLAARLMLRALSRIPGNEWRLAASLDFPRGALFRFVEWPALLRVLPGIAGLIFMLCVTSFTIVLTLGGGPSTSTLEVAIYQALKFEYDPPRALALCALQLIVTAAIFFLLNRFPDPEEDRGARPAAAFRPDSGSGSSRLLDATVLVIFLAFVGAPLVALLTAGLKADIAKLISDSLFRRALTTSLTIAFSAGLLAVLLTYSAQRARLALVASGWRKAGRLFRLPEFTLLIPPLALGAGWFLFLLNTGVEGNPAIAVVIAINGIIALPFTSRVLGPELRTHAIRTSRLADSLDLSGFDRFRIVDWPVLRWPVLTAFSFGMALSLGDLGAIALFGSDDFVTLPSLLYAKLGSYRSTDAAGLSLILGVLCLLLMAPALRSDGRHAEDRG